MKKNIILLAIIAILTLTGCGTWSPETTAPATESETWSPETTAPATESNEYVRKYGSDDSQWVQFVQNEATQYSHNVWEQEITFGLYWTEVQERLQKNNFLTDAETWFFRNQGYSEITNANNIPTWFRHDEGLYPEMYYPIVVTDHEGYAWLTYTSCLGNLVQISLGNHTYYNLGEAHADPLQCDFGGDGYTPEQMRHTDTLIISNEEFMLCYNEADCELSVWSQGKKSNTFDVPDGFSWVPFNFNTTVTAELADTAWIFQNKAGEIWFFAKLQSLADYNNYSGGMYLK